MASSKWHNAMAFFPHDYCYLKYFKLYPCFTNISINLLYIIKAAQEIFHCIQTVYLFAANALALIELKQKVFDSSMSNELA